MDWNSILPYLGIAFVLFLMMRGGGCCGGHHSHRGHGGDKSGSDKGPDKKEQEN